MVKLPIVLIGFGLMRMDARAGTFVGKHQFAGQISGNGSGNVSMRVDAEGNAEISDLMAESTRKLSPHPVRDAKQQKSVRIDADGHVEIFDNAVSANKVSPSFIHDAQQLRNMKGNTEINNAEAFRKKHQQRSKDVAEDKTNDGPRDYGGNDKCSLALRSLSVLELVREFSQSNVTSMTGMRQRSYTQDFTTHTILKKDDISKPIIPAGSHSVTYDAHDRVQLSHTGTHGSVKVVLQLTHLMNASDQCRMNKISRARSQLPAGYELICFWWTDEDSPYKDWPPMSLMALRHACGQQLITFHKDVLPHYRQTINALQLSLHNSIENESLPKWQWWYADVAFILSYQIFRDTFFSQADLIWYIEDDLHWTGDLGDMLSQLHPDSPISGYGIQRLEEASTNCTHHADWHICRHVPTFIDKCNDFSHGLIQMVWYSPRLLEKLVQHLESTEFAYCEAFASSVCSKMEDCQIDEFGKRAPDLFQHYTWRCCFEVEFTTQNQIVHPAKNCNSRLYDNAAPVRNSLES